MRRYKDKESFVKLGNELHNNFYDYTDFIYRGKNVKGVINCPIHGPFSQTPNVHVRSIRPSGCPLCAIENKRVSFEEFVKRARSIHGDDYEYNQSDYIDMKTDMNMYCKKHDYIFKQTPNNHVHKTNPTKCPLCASEIVIQKNRKTFDDFLVDAHKVHGENYDYKREDYVNAITKIEIFCKKCGKYFRQTPHQHLSGKGCPHCKRSLMEERISLILDKEQIIYNEQKTFDWLKYRQRQYLDFYLPDYNVAIECQGEQHFKPVDFSHKKDINNAEKRFILNQKRDENKRKLCEKHNIHIYYIIYNENINKRINDILNEIKNK